MKGDKNIAIRVIRVFWLHKKITFTSLKEAQASIKINLRAAEAIKDYAPEKIIATMRHLEDTAKDWKWTLWTVGKYIDELNNKK